MEQFLKNINFENVKVVIIASPGFTQEDFKKFLIDKIENNKEYTTLKNNIKINLYTFIFGF